MQGSCNGANRLSSWQMGYDGRLTWDDDGMNIKADILQLSDRELVLSVKRDSGEVEESYTSAQVPSVLCPDTTSR